MCGELPHFFPLPSNDSAILNGTIPGPNVPRSRIGAPRSLRTLLVLAVIALVGCSADGIHSPQKFFPGSTRTSWDACDPKFGQVGNEVVICASTGLMPGASAPSYNMQFALPAPVHVR